MADPLLRVERPRQHARRRRPTCAHRLPHAADNRSTLPLSCRPARRSPRCPGCFARIVALR
jgi:hypothetical protein